MATRIVMPSFGMYTAEGVVGRWLAEAGSEVAAGDLVVEIVTEKATYDVEAPGPGRLHPVAAEGAPIVVEGLLGWLLEDGEAVPGSADASRSAAADAAALAAVTGADAAAAPPAAATAPPAGRVVASPLARRLAAERGIDLATLAGSGPGGRIVEADVLAAAAPLASPPAASELVAAAPTPTAPRALPWRVLRTIPLTGDRGAIARKLRRVAETAVSLTLTREVRADALVAARRELSQRLAAEIPFDALFAKALAAAVREQPDLNAVVEGDAIHVLDEVHVGFAVAVPGSLVVPVVRDADRRSLAEVAGDVREYAARARAGELLPEMVLGGTITISNLGARLVDAFTPVLNPPQSAILGIGRVAERAVVENGQVVAGRTLFLSLTFDHRVADGAPAAELLDAVARRIGDAAWLRALGDAV